jgi:osmotically-inducible protein OsmY
MRTSTTLLLALLAGGCVPLPASGTPSGAELDARLVRVLERRLFADQRLCAFPIEVAARKGDVALTGWVGSQAQRQRAEAMAREAGARHVHNRLVIRASAQDRERC